MSPENTPNNLYENQDALIKPDDAANSSPAPQGVVDPQAATTDNSFVQEPQSGWNFNQEDQSAERDTSPTASSVGSVHWTASEYIAHHKGIGWYVALGLVLAVLSGVLYAMTREILSPVMVLVIGIAFGIMAARQPQELNYSVDSKGLQIGPRLYPFGGFSSFSVVESGGIRSITLVPMQRFMPPLSIYYDPADEQKIVEVISAFLPYQEPRYDYVERLMRKIRF
jgi:hypothetical protein